MRDEFSSSLSRARSVTLFAPGEVCDAFDEGDYEDGDDHADRRVRHHGGNYRQPFVELIRLIQPSDTSCSAIIAHRTKRKLRKL
jgi:hypothetical protein